jgi:hypothetical protein
VTCPLSHQWLAGSHDRTGFNQQVEPDTGVVRAQHGDRADLGTSLNGLSWRSLETKVESAAYPDHHAAASLCRID